MNFAGCIKPVRPAAIRHLLAWAALAAGLLALPGCGAPELETEYGKRAGPAGRSVNGTAVLAEMFAAAGHRVESRRALSPAVREARTIVWFPDDFAPPSGDARMWLDDWLENGADHTLIYVGRDFDAEPMYWRKVAKSVTAEQQSMHKRRQAEADYRYRMARKTIPAPRFDDWFETEQKDAPLSVRDLSGPWAEGIEAARTEIPLANKIKSSEEVSILLDSKAGVLATLEYPDATLFNRRIIVANGSFLLNLPLVNHEHRKLAGKLIAEVGEPGRLVFLESSAGGPPVFSKEPEQSMSGAWAITRIWPISAILLHLAALGIIFCFARYPIFGVPIEPPPPPLSDFGEHVKALGKLLARTRDRPFALGKLAHYHELKGI